MGSKLDETNKNIQLEKRKLGTNSKNNFYDKSIKDNSLINNGDCHQNFAASNQHRKIISDVDATQIQNRNYQENFINTSNQNNPINFKFLRNKR